MKAIDKYYDKMWAVNTLYYVPVPKVPLNANAFPAYLEIDTRNHNVPVFILQYRAVASYSKLAFSLVNGGDGEGRRTFHCKCASTAFNMFNEASLKRSGTRLAHVVTDKGVHYYGMNGLILDGNYNPLLISTVTYTDLATITVTDPVCKVSYRVFENPSGIIEKAIIQQIIPMCKKFGAGYFLRYAPLHNRHIKVEVDDYDYMVVKPVRPNLKQISPESVNSMILQYYEND